MSNAIEKQIIIIMDTAPVSVQYVRLYSTCTHMIHLILHCAHKICNFLKNGSCILLIYNSGHQLQSMRDPVMHVVDVK